MPSEKAMQLAQQINAIDEAIFEDLGPFTEKGIRIISTLIDTALAEARREALEEAAIAAHNAMFDLTMGKAGGVTSKLSPHECCYGASSAIRALAASTVGETK